MGVPLILFAVPVWIALISWEVVISTKKKDGIYRFNDSMGSVMCGLVSRIPRFFLMHALTAPYRYITSHFRLTNAFSENNVLNAILVLLVVDASYYWAHRFSHMVNLAWGGHVVHHSSEEYNFTTALRQSFFEPIITTPIYLAAALFFPFELFAFYSEINTIFQFFVHTRYVEKLPAPIEFVFNTPSHHRCHHARNPVYIDKNFAGMFIIWDRLFGTYEEEVEEPVFGITSPLDSWNPLWASIHHLVHVMKTSLNVPGFSTKLKVLALFPGYNPYGPDYDIPPVEAGKVRKYDTHISTLLKAYIFVHFLICSAITIYLAVRPDMKTLHMVGFSSVLLATTASIGMLLDLRRYSLQVELVRNLTFGMLLVALVLAQSKIIAALGATISVFSAGFISLVLLRRLVDFGSDKIITPVNYLLEELEGKSKQE